MKLNRNPVNLLIAIFMLLAAACSQPQLDMDASTTRAAADSPAITGIYCGGVSGIDALAVAENSDAYRANGGNVYLHTVGWSTNRLTEAQRRTIIDTVWKDREFGIEMGFDSDPARMTARPNAFVKLYQDRGIEPAFLTLNAFSSDRIPDVDLFNRTVQEYRDRGMNGWIFATFEYQNFPTRIPTLAQNKVSMRSDFQQLISSCGGMTIDTPSAVFFRREQNYRDWVVDAVQWAKARGYTVGIIISPNSSKTSYDEDTKRYIDYLKEHNAVPTFIIVENYSTEDPSTYANIVGNEDTPHHQLGLASLIQTRWLPSVPTEPQGPAGYTYAAAENGRFTLPGLCDVAYGANGQFSYRQGVSGVLTFNNATFGDPLPGVRKYGFYRIAATPTDIIPYIKINDGAWNRTNRATVNPGDRVWLGPQPVNGGSWSWSGDLSGSNRSLVFTAAESVNLRATYTNESGARSTEDFVITVRTAPPDPDLTVLSANDKDKAFTVNGIRTFRIPTGGGAVIQVRKPWQTNVLVSINDGTYKPTPADWGGEFPAPANSTVTVKIKTDAARVVNFNWW